MSVRKRTWKTAKGEAKEAWVVDYADQAGKRRLKTFKRKKDADAFEAKARVEVREGVHTPDSESVTISEAANLWLISCSALERATVTAYEQHVKLHIVPLIGSVKLSRLNVPTIRAFEDRLRQDRSNAMAKKVIGSLGAIVGDAQERGLRASELRGLRWADVNFDKRELHVRQRADRYNQIGKPKSHSGDRTVPFPPLVANTLKEWKLACPHGEFVFPTGAGTIETHSNIVKRGLAPVQVAAGVVNAEGKAKYTGLHSFRHFYASWCINRKADGGLELPLKTVQARLGHSKPWR